MHVQNTVNQNVLSYVINLLLQVHVCGIKFFIKKRVIIKSLQCYLKLKNENGTPKPCKILKGAAHGKMS